MASFHWRLGKAWRSWPFWTELVHRGRGGSWVRWSQTWSSGRRPSPYTTPHLKQSKFVIIAHVFFFSSVQSVCTLTSSLEGPAVGCCSVRCFAAAGTSRWPWTLCWWQSAWRRTLGCARHSSDREPSPARRETRGQLWTNFKSIQFKKASKSHHANQKYQANQTHKSSQMESIYN